MAPRNVEWCYHQSLLLWTFCCVFRNPVCITWEMQVKTTMRSHIYSDWPLQNGVTQYGNSCQELRETGTCSLSWDVKWCSLHDASSQSWNRSTTSSNPILSQQNLCVILSKAASWVCLQIQSISRDTVSSGVSDSGQRRKGICYRDLSFCFL